MLLTIALTTLGLTATTRQEVLVATTRHFAFYSDVRVNLHDALNRFTRTEDAPDAEASACLRGLSQEERDGWTEALAFYRERLSELFLRGEEMAAVRSRFLDPGASAGGELVDTIFAHLESAAPAYRACLWEAQDRENRAWIDDVAPRVRAHEEALTARLAKLFQSPWPTDPIRVDVTAWVSPSGGNTTDVPAHVMISSRDPSYRGDAGLEMAFHESSHLIIDIDKGKVAEELWRANGDRMLPRRDLWHTILFYTVGRATKDRLAETGTQDYVPYLYAQGLIERGWRVYRETLETDWQAYMDGEIDLATAMDRMMASVHGPED